jgi:hypothetical protein
LVRRFMVQTKKVAWMIPGAIAVHGVVLVHPAFRVEV